MKLATRPNWISCVLRPRIQYLLENQRYNDLNKIIEIDEFKPDPSLLIPPLIFPPHHQFHIFLLPP